MHITTVSASVRYSKALGQGRHKTVELSASADIDPQEDWRNAQAELYQELGQQLKTLWSPESSAQVIKEEDGNPDITDHYCFQHQTPFQRYEKDDEAWYSHKTDSGWCREKQAAQAA